jgi:hypothetical protein
MSSHAKCALAILCYGALAWSSCIRADIRPPEAQPSPAQLVLRQSILTRAIAIEAPDKLTGLLDTMPSGVLPREAKSARTRAALWSLFFSGSMTKLARVPSPQPFIAFYNPFADVALIEGCKVDPLTRVMLCTQACAVPGELLTGDTVGLRPSWIGSSDPVKALQRTAGERMRAFGEAHPVASPETSFWRRTYCSSESQSTSEKRLISLANSTAQLDGKKFREAGYHYLATAIRKAAARQTEPGQSTPDGVVAVLTHLREASLGGALQARPGTWEVFLTEKQNGWHIAVLTANASPNGTWVLQSAEFLRIAVRRP